MNVYGIYLFVSFLIIAVMLGLSFVGIVSFFALILAPIAVSFLAPYIAVAAIFYLGIYDAAFTYGKRWAGQFVAFVHNVFNKHAKIHPDLFWNERTFYGRV